MATAVHGPVSEDDLQDLYTKVWSSYSDPEPQDPSFGLGRTPSVALAPPGGRSGLPTSPRDPTRPAGGAPGSPALGPGGSRRPLPRPPGSSAGPSSSSGAPGMPEPRPYSAGGGSSSGRGGFSDGSRGQHGPASPTSSNASFPHAGGAGLPADPRPHPTNGHADSDASHSPVSSVSAGASLPAAGGMSMPIPEIHAPPPPEPYLNGGGGGGGGGGSYFAAADAGGDLGRSSSLTSGTSYTDGSAGASSSSAHLTRNTSAMSALSSYQVVQNAPASASFLVDRDESFLGGGHAYTHRATDPPFLHTQASFASLGGGAPGPSAARPTALQDIKRGLGLHDYADGGPGGGLDGDGVLYDDEDDDELESDEGDDRFVNFALLSHLAVRLRDNVPRGTHVKGNIPYPRAFTGKDIVSTIQSQIQRELLITHNISTTDRRQALQVARSLQSQLFFYEVEWGSRALEDSVEDVYMFLDDLDGGAEGSGAGAGGAGVGGGGGGDEGLPTGVITMMTKCYSPSCSEDEPCYAYVCPRRKEAQQQVVATPAPQPDVVPRSTAGGWADTVDKSVLNSLPSSEIDRQKIIYNVIAKETTYVNDLNTIETLFIRPLRSASPPIIPAHELDDFIDTVFHNVLDLRETNRRLLEHLRVRQREQWPVILRVGDVFLEAATEFRLAYPHYVGHIPIAEKRMREEVESNAEFRLFLENCSRHPSARRFDLKHFLSRPSEHLQKYPVLLEAILQVTTDGNPDMDFLNEAIHAIRHLQTASQLLTFQSAMGKGPASKLQWYDLVPEDVRSSIPKPETKRQSIMFELIAGEMSYLRDLENIDVMYVQPLRDADPPIIPPQRLNAFITDVFHNFGQLVFHHRRLLERLHSIQQDEHPILHSVTAALLDAFLNFRDAYLEYVPNYPIAAYRIEEEKATNARFRQFHDQAVRHPEASRQDMKAFVNRPIPRLLRYQLLMESVLKETPADHDDREAIPQLLEVIKALGKETEPGVHSAEQKVELWRYNTGLVFKPGEAVDMDLLDENRSLIHAGKLLRQPDSGLEFNGWTELFVLAFDNYVVMTKPKEKDGVTKYQVTRRPIPLDLLTLTSFSDPPTQRSGGILRGLRGGNSANANAYNQPTPESASDSRSVYPCTLHYNGRMGGLTTLYAESAAIRAEWKTKLEEAIGLRKVVQESNKVFEAEVLSSETFLLPAMMGNVAPSYNNENMFTGKVTCSIPFTTSDGRALMAIGCAEGVWIGFRHDPRSLRRVLHLKMVTQCAMLEDFGIFLVLADKSLFAYHIEALVPTSMQSANMSQTPQKLSGARDVHFFSVGQMHGRTLVIYMKKKGMDSVFRVLEPVVGHINDRTRQPASLTSRLMGRQRSDWFRTYREFFLPSEAYDLVFLKARIAVLCTKGFEIMDLTDFKSVTIPQRDDPRLEKLAKRCDACRPMGMFRSNTDEFLLCYDEFGLYVDRHGDPSRTSMTIEWEGTAERVAYHQPYVLLFDSRFIEIRHIESGRLAQIIPGNDVRCIWDGRGASTGPTATPGPEGWGQENNLDQEARVHAVMTAPDPNSARGGRPTAQVQHVFELIPTIPLYLPGSLQSPDQTSYFPQSNSPPHSPRASLNHTNSWR